MTQDPWRPPAPTAAYFDSSQDAWVLSRYRDVSAAMREPGLQLAGPHRDSVAEPVDESAQTRMRSLVAGALSPARLLEWRGGMEAAAQAVVAALPADRPVDVVGEFARPWGSAAAVLVTGAAPSPSLQDLARVVSMAAADPEDAELRLDAAAASAELGRNFSSSGLPMAGAAFVSLSQTVPCLLASAWLALLRHPAELARLSAGPGSMPRAIDELLRYAGLARTLYRIALTDVDVAGTRIPQGQRGQLRVHSANHDPEVFDDPGRLDLSRRESGQLALGAGLNACVGANLIRMAAAVATSAFVTRFAAAKLVSEPVWRGGSGFRWPDPLRMI